MHYFLFSINMGCGSSDSTVLNSSISPANRKNFIPNTVLGTNDDSYNIHVKDSISSTEKKAFNEIIAPADDIIGEYQSYASSKFKWDSYLQEIDLNSNEFYFVNRICCLPYKIKKIEKVINLKVYLKYITQKYLNYITYGEVGEHVVFYGSRQDPTQICLNETGIDFRDNKQKKPLGEGAHFSEDSIFSDSHAFQNKSIHKIVMAKIIFGNIHEIGSADSSLRKPPDNSNFITTEINQTQRIYTCYENFNALPWYIITYNTDEKVIPPIFEVWGWQFSENSFVPFPGDINFLLNKQFRDGVDIKQEKFKFLKYSSIEKDYEIILEDKCLYIRNNECNERVKLEKRLLKNCKSISELKKLFITELEEDHEDLVKIFSNFDFSNRHIEMNVKDTVIKIKDMLLKKDAEIILRNLNHSDTEYIKVQRNFEMTMPKNVAKIKKIEKIDNNFLNLKYLIQKCLFELMARDTNLKYLFHGTSNNKPEVIYTNPIGFDMRYSNAGLWGKGIYFAANANYSNNYAYVNGSEKQIFLCEVILGTCTEKTETTNSEIIKPAKGYDTVLAYAGNSDIYIKYENSFVYPSYLITYICHET
jgi:hypothetical protein